MREITREKDDWAQYVIYVQKCDRYEYEYQPDMPWLNKKESIHKTSKFVNKRINDIMVSRENYFKNSGK